MNRCSIIIPVFNRASLTRQCLDLVLRHLPARDACEIVVVDDGSTDQTPDLLTAYEDRLRIVTHPFKTGFASACNSGAAVASGHSLVFLNNDTLPTAGWLDALLDAADQHPAFIIGAKLLYPNDTVQHAGIVFSQDGYPRHLYAGFPADHPAVNKSRRFQAVTAACMLVPRQAFSEVGGFDGAYRNGLEDVDLCLSLGRRGHEIRYCHQSVLYHLESVAEGRFSANKENTRLYRQRWASRVQPDDLRYYVEDGLLRLDYVDGDCCPLRLSAAPLLALVDGRERQEELGRVLRLRSRQVQVLLKEVIRLTAQAFDVAPPAVLSAPEEHSLRTAMSSAEPGAQDSRQVLIQLETELLSRDQQILAAIYELQHGLSSRADQSSGVNGFAPSERLRYESDLELLRNRIREALPAGAKVAVVSRGDEILRNVDGRSISHFPQTNEGAYSGHYPADSADAIRQFEALRDRGVEYLLFPKTAFWWLEHYVDFRKHLETHYPVVVHDQQTCLVFGLNAQDSGEPGRVETAKPGEGREPQPPALDTATFSLEEVRSQ